MIMDYDYKDESFQLLYGMYKFLVLDYQFGSVVFHPVRVFHIIFGVPYCMCFCFLFSLHSLLVFYTQLGC